MIVASGCTNASGSMSGSMSPRAYSAMAQLDSNLVRDGRGRLCMSKRSPSRATRSSRTRSSPISSTRSTRTSKGSNGASTSSRRRTRSKATTRSASTTCSRSERCTNASRCTSTCSRSSTACSTPAVWSRRCRRSRSCRARPRSRSTPTISSSRLPKPHPPTVCNSMWALTDFTEANGATRLVPGSHLWDHSPDYGKPYDSIAAEMPKGSVLMWHGSLWHGGGANTTDARRIGIAMNYCAGGSVSRRTSSSDSTVPPWTASSRGCATRRLRRLQHADRAHQQAQSRRAAPRQRARTGRNGLGRHLTAMIRSA